MKRPDARFFPKRILISALALTLSPGFVQSAENPKPLPKAAEKPTQQMQLETTTITGHHELPRVLYIVPWKRAEAGELPGRPPDSLLDEALMPLDRPEFRREIRYSDQRVADRAAATASAPANQSSQSKSSGE